MKLLKLGGEPTARDLESLLGELERSRPPDEVVVDLADLDLEDAADVVALAEGLRSASARSSRVEILEAPQVLAHTLYRIGALQNQSLVLTDPRNELGTAG